MPALLSIPLKIGVLSFIPQSFFKLESEGFPSQKLYRVGCVEDGQVGEKSNQ
jgi:hypothetical protein